MLSLATWLTPTFSMMMMMMMKGRYGSCLMIVFKVAVLTYRAVHGTAPPHLSSELTRVADVTTRSRLRSSSTDQLIVPSHRLSAVGARAFPVAGAYIWNGLPADVTSLHHCRCSDNAWRQFCSAAAIRTYVLSELCLPSLTVVLAVLFILRPL